MSKTNLVHLSKKQIAKNKKFRKLFAMMIMKIKEKLGIKLISTYNYQNIVGGATNIIMAREDPFLVMNTYPMNQYDMVQQSQPLTVFPGLI